MRNIFGYGRESKGQREKKVIDGYEERDEADITADHTSKERKTKVADSYSGGGRWIKRERRHYAEMPASK